MSPTLFKIYLHRTILDWLSKCSGMGIPVGNDSIYTLLFADDQVVISQDYEDMEYMLRKLLEEYEKWGLKVNLDKTFYMGCGNKMEDLILEDQKCFTKGREEFDYLGVRIVKEDRQESDIKNRINKGRAKIAMLNSIFNCSPIFKIISQFFFSSFKCNTVIKKVKKLSPKKPDSDDVPTISSDYRRSNGSLI